MRAAGRIAGVGSFEHSENWVAADGTPVQLTDDPALAGAVSSAGEIVVDGVTLRVISIVELLHDLARHLRPAERAVLDQLPK